MPDAFLAGAGSAQPAPGDEARRTAVELAAESARAALGAVGLGPDGVDRLVFSCALPCEPVELALASAVAAELGSSPPYGCHGASLGEASGLLAVALAADAVRGGAARAALAGGADTASRVPYWVPGLREGPRDEPGVVVDPLPGSAADPAGGGHSALGLEGGDRAAQDAFAIRSHRRAQASGLGPGAAQTPERLARLKPLHSTEGTITAGNSARAADGAAAVLLAPSPPEGAGRVIVGAWEISGGAPGGVAAAIGGSVRRLAEAHGTGPRELVAIEIHECSAALCLAVARELELDPEDLNALGGEIATGSPGAAAGPLMVERARRQLEGSRGPGVAIVAMAAPGGQALALALESRPRPG